MENKYDEIFSLIRKREGFERSQEIVESMKYLFDESRYDKVIPFIDYQQSLISAYRDELFLVSGYKYYYKYLMITSIAINIIFIGFQIWRITK
jgi:hypothetical protein